MPPPETALAQQQPEVPAVRRYSLTPTAPQRKGLVDYDRDLSDEQRAVALCEPRRPMVIAGAGSGKTRALTYRAAHLRGFLADRGGFQAGEDPPAHVHHLGGPRDDGARLAFPHERDSHVVGR